MDFHEVDRDRWADFESLFESRGGPKACWCMVWRARGEEVRQTRGADRKRAISGQVREGIPIGLLGYRRGVPIAWCSVAPKSTYRKLDALPSMNEAVWSLVCFFVKREFWGEGVTTLLIEATAQHAARRGAEILEAYPVDPDSPSYRFMGFVPVFERAGFRPAGSAGSRRHVMRLKLV